MNPRSIGLILAVLLIVGVILLLELSSPRSAQVDENISSYDGPEVGGIADEINTESGSTRIADHIGKDVILIDFWTYSCINCLRTLPYLRTWWETYKEDGLLIIGIHTPEFSFEKKIENVQMAVDKHQINWPVLLDNDYVTWRNFQNRYWPRKYLIDIHGKIVYDRIGEGGYAETESQIQEALAERARVLNLAMPPAQNIVEEDSASTTSGQTPEIYFGTAFRRGNFANTEGFSENTVRKYSLPESPSEKHQTYLDGTWFNSADYMETQSEGAIVLLNYYGKQVNIVAGSDVPTKLDVLLDGQKISSEHAGTDIQNGKLHVAEHDLYNVVSSASAGLHELKLILPSGVKMYTFTFG